MLPCHLCLIRVWQQDDAWVCSMADGSSPQARPAPKHCPSFWSQLTALSSRLLRNTTRHPFIIALNFTATLLLAITLAFIFYNAGELVPRCLLL